jgi:hypothetical protein
MAWPATEALLNAPTTMHLAPNGDLFIADSGNHRVRRVAAGSGRHHDGARRWGRGLIGRGRAGVDVPGA